MHINQIRRKLKTEEYSFLKENEHLGNNIILLGLGGSYSYGTNTPTSDIDIRGIALNDKKEILLKKDFSQIVESNTDTVVWSFNKIIELFSECNPNTIQLLGLKPEHYLYISPIGQKILDNKSIFLSQRAKGSFGAYATDQFYRMNQKAAKQMHQKELEEHILRVLLSMEQGFHEKYTDYPEDAIHLYTDKAVQKDFDTEIFMDINLHHYPLRDYASLWSEMQNTVKAYKNIGKRNKHAIEHDKLGKHMMTLIYLYIMGIDILEKGEIITFREKEHDLLMSIKRGEYLNSEGKPIPEFLDLVKEFENKINYAAKNTILPEEPNYEAINELIIDVNNYVVTSDFKQINEELERG